MFDCLSRDFSCKEQMRIKKIPMLCIQYQSSRVVGFCGVTEHSLI